MLKAIPWLLMTTGLVVISSSSYAKTEAVVNLDVKHTVGGKETFDREKYITVHSTLTDNEWNGEEDKLQYLMEDLDVYFGRENGGAGWNFNQAQQDDNNAGYADPEHIISQGKYARETGYGVNKAAQHKYDDRGDIMVGGQPSPHWFGVTNPCCGGESWQANGANAVGDFLGQYINEFFRSEGESVTSGYRRPKYFEVLNEPLYQLTDAPHELGLETPVPPVEVFQFHSDVAAAFRDHNTQVKIGGFTVAFPIFEERNFDRWNERMKLFIDTAGDNMDFYSTHFYDLEDSNRFKGSRIEATLDMMDNYSAIKFGQPKEHIISEYGGRNRPMENEAWSPLRDWWFLKAASPMMMQFMDRPDNILKTIPFVTLKALWGTRNDIPYNWRLLRQAKEGEGETGDHWVFTEMVKFYELWSDVNGTRVDSYSTNPDILVDSYVAQDKAYVIFSNLTKETETVLLHKFGSTTSDVQSVKVKHLYLAGNKPQLDVITANADLDSFDLAPEATIVIEYTYNSDIKIDATSFEKKYFATEYFKEINSNIANNFELRDVTTSEFSEVILRIAIGRDHGTSLIPNVTVNGTLLTAVAQISGDDQTERSRLFGLLEIPVPSALIETNNTVGITFPDDGGHIASVNMKVFNFDKDARPDGGDVSGMFISPASNTLSVGDTVQVTASVTPFFATDQSFNLFSSDPSVATVAQNGLVTAVKAGKVTITATSNDGIFEAKSIITVEDPVAESLSFDDQSIYVSTVYNTADGMNVTTNYEAGTGFQVSSDLGGVNYLLRHMTAGWGVISDVAVTDNSAIGQQRGVSNVTIPLDGLTPTDELTNGEFYFLFTRVKSTSGVTKSVAAYPINIEKYEDITTPFLALDDDTKYRSTIYTTDGTLDITANFEVGNGNTVTNELGGVRFFLREMDQTWSQSFGDVIVSDASAVDKQSGIASASLSLDGLTPTTELPEGHFYFLFAQAKSSDGTIYNIPGVAPIVIEQGAVEASFAVDDVNKYQTTEYFVGDNMEVTVNFEMGTGNTVANNVGGVRYYLRHLKADYSVVKDIIIEDASVIGMQAGVSTVNIPLASATPSADLPAGDFYFLFVLTHSSDGSTHKIQIHHPQILSAATVVGDLDADGDVDRDDLTLFSTQVSTGELTDLSFDFNADGLLSRRDNRGFMALCTRARCATE